MAIVKVTDADFRFKSRIWCTISRFFGQHGVVHVK